MAGGRAAFKEAPLRSVPNGSGCFQAKRTRRACDAADMGRGEALARVNCASPARRAATYVTVFAPGKVRVRGFHVFDSVWVVHPDHGQRHALQRQVGQRSPVRGNRLPTLVGGQPLKVCQEISPVVEQMKFGLQIGGVPREQVRARPEILADERPQSVCECG